MQIKKMVVIMIAAATFLSGCGMGQTLPEYTSDDWGLYLSKSGEVNTVVDRKGEIAYDYSLDKNGNVTDGNRNIIIAKKNIYPFVRISNIEIDESEFAEVTLDKEIRNSSDNEGADNIEPVAETISAELEISPVNATCREIILETSDRDIVEIEGGDENGTKTVMADVTGHAEFKLNIKKDGAVSLTVRSADNGFETNRNILVKLNEKALNEEEKNSDNQTDDREMVTEQEINSIVTNPVYSSEETVIVTNSIPTTESTPAWINGSKVNIREEPSSSSTVLATYSTGKSVTVLGNAKGWTKIQTDGMTGYLKTVYITTSDPNRAAATPTPMLNSNATVTRSSTSQGQNTYYNGSTSGTSNGTGSTATGATAVNAPPASNDGYDHGYAFSSEASPVGNADHAHDFKVSETVPPSGSTSGYTLYRCPCGETYTGPYTETAGSETGHVHSWSDSLKEATCEEIGYTEHSCAVCGESYRDLFVSSLGHSFESAETEEGLLFTCVRCGYSYVTDEE